MADTQADTSTAAQSGTTKGTFGLIKDEAANLKSTAADAARNAATTGKDKAAGALGEVAKLVDDAARQLDERLGANVGDYARRASSTVTGLSTSLQDKDLDELIEDGKELIRRNPAVAIGVAAAAGFLLTRLIKLGNEAEGPSSSYDYDREREADR